MVGKDLYWGRTNSQGKTVIIRSRVWDAERFLEARRKEGAEQKDPKDNFIVSVQTEQEFKAQ